MFGHLLAAALFLGQLAFNAHARPIVKKDAGGEYAVHGISSICSEDRSVCILGFTISDSNDDEPIPAFCHITFRTTADPVTVNVAIEDEPCIDLPQYHIGASWSPVNNYMLLTVDNVEQNRRAYFGLEEDELYGLTMPFVHHSPAYIVTSPEAPAEAEKARLMLVKRQEDDGDTELEQTEINEDPNNTIDDIEAPGTVDDAPSADEIFDGDDYYGELDDEFDDEYADPNSDEFDEDLIEDPIDDDQLVDGTFEESYGDAYDEDDFYADPTDGSESLTEPVILGDGQIGFKTTEEPDESTSDDIVGLTVPEKPVAWLLRNVTRDVEYGPNAVTMGFLIDVLPDGPESIHCDIRVDLDNDMEPLFASFFYQQCQDSDWYFSWGYNRNTDAAVATLINPEKKEEAWFGWNSVNSKLPETDLSNVGPGIVQACNC